MDQERIKEINAGGYALLLLFDNKVKQRENEGFPIDVSLNGNTELGLGVLCVCKYAAYLSTGPEGTIDEVRDVVFEGRKEDEISNETIERYKCYAQGMVKRLGLTSIFKTEGV